MPGGATACFAVAAATDPGRVWAVLTCPEARYLYGQSMHSGWAPGDAVEVGSGMAGPAGLRGTVLVSVPGERLSFSLEDPSGTSTYLTWEIRMCPSTADAPTVVRLWVDDSEGGSTEELEDTWLPVLACVADAARTAPAD